MSAYAHLAGFYSDSMNTYPTSTGAWPTHWTPVPVHTVEEETDHVGHCFLVTDIQKKLSIPVTE